MWVEIYERGERMFADLGSGECQWIAPPGVPVKPFSRNQWWELFDHISGRFYYYNTVQSVTVWHRPYDADIIPLARFQQKDEEKKMKAGGRLPSSAGHSMSSREDLIEAIEEETTLPCKFSTFQPKPVSGHKYSRSNVIIPIKEAEPSSVLKFKEPLHQRSQSCVPDASRCVRQETDTRVPGVGAERPRTPTTLSRNAHSAFSTPVLEKKTHRSVETLDSKSGSPGFSKYSAKSIETLTKTPENKMQRAHSTKGSTRSPARCLESSFGQAASPAFQLNKGFMKKPTTVGELLIHQKKALKRPLTISPSKLVQREFNDCFKCVNNYMKTESNEDLKKLVVNGWNQSDLANEIFAIIIKQSRDNPAEESLRRGLELMAILLFFTAPSSTLADVIVEWLDEVVASGKAADLHLEKTCRNNLEKILIKGNRRGLVEPSLSEIQQAKRLLYHESMFGISLQQLLAAQKERFPELEIPWIQKELTKEIIRLGGFTTEGIFRLPGEIDKVNALKAQVEEYEIVDSSSVDCHVACSLLKLWFRELSEPIFPVALTEEILNSSENMELSVAIVAKLPAENRATLLHLIRFLQAFTKPDVILKTRMDSSNLGMVMAPNLFRPVSDDPRALLDNSRREINLLRNLIEGLDTEEAAIYDSEFRVDIV